LAHSLLAHQRLVGRADGGMKGAACVVLVCGRCLADRVMSGCPALLMGFTGFGG